MKKSAEKVKTPRPYLSHSQLWMWEHDPELYRKTYLLGEKKSESMYLALGKKISEARELDADNTHEANHLKIFWPYYPEKQKKIKAITSSGVPLYGITDGFSKKGNKIIIGEEKTGKNFFASKIRAKDQLQFYALIVMRKYGVKAKLVFHFAKTVESEEGIKISGEVRSEEIPLTLTDLLRMSARTKKAWQGIQEMCKKEFSVFK